MNLEKRAIIQSICFPKDVRDKINKIRQSSGNSFSGEVVIQLRKALGI